MERPAFDTLWSRLGLASDVPLDGTITHRTPSSGRSAEAMLLPHLSAAPGADLEITGLLGEGGMGCVHLARQRSLARDVAIKTLKPHRADERGRDALLKEAVLTGFLEHPSIVPIHALGKDESGVPVLVMKRVEGVTWQALLRDPSHSAWSSVDVPGGDKLLAHLSILLQVCNALHFAHQRGVIHRDLKPSNVMVGSFGEVYLVDFGIAMMKGAKQRRADDEDMEPVVGTPVYMAPEMAASQTDLIDERTDVYLLGATLHEVLMGKPRHTGETIFNVLEAAYESVPFAYPSAVPAELGAICNRATSREREDRYPSALSFRQAVSAYIHHRGSMALSEASASRLDEIERAVRAPPEASTSAIGDLERTMTECRFGFTQALREWPENSAAKAGLARCLGAMIEIEIREGNARSARALLTELGGDRPALEKRVAALELETKGRAARDAELRQLKRDADLTVSGRARAALFGLSGGAALALAVAFQLRRQTIPTHADLIGVAAVGILVFALAMGFFRRRLLGNATSRRLMASFVMTMCMSLANRVVSAVRGFPIESTVFTDLYLMAACTVLVGVTIAPRFLWAVALPGLSILIATINPRLLGIVTSITTFGLLIVVGYLGWGQPSKSPKPPTR